MVDIRKEYRRLKMSDIKNENVEITENEDTDLKYIDLEEPKKEEKVVSKKRKKKDRKAALNRTQFIEIVAGVCVVGVIGGVCAYNTSLERNKQNGITVQDDRQALDIDGATVVSEPNEDLIFHWYEKVTPAKQEWSTDEIMANTTQIETHNIYQAIDSLGNTLDFDLQNRLGLVNVENLSLHDSQVFLTDDSLIITNQNYNYFDESIEQETKLNISWEIESSNVQYLYDNQDKLLQYCFDEIYEHCLENRNGISPEKIQTIMTDLNVRDENYKITNLILFTID